MVRQEDLIRFDRLVFGRKGNLFDLLLHTGAGAAGDDEATLLGGLLPRVVEFQDSSTSSRQVHFGGMENPMDRFIDLSSEACVRTVSQIKSTLKASKPFFLAQEELLGCATPKEIMNRISTGVEKSVAVLSVLFIWDSAS